MKKVGSFFLVIKFNLAPKLWSWKCHKWLILIFSADYSNKLVTVWAQNLSACERSFWIISGNGMANRLPLVSVTFGYRVTVLETLRVEIWKKLLVQQKVLKSCFFKDSDLANAAQNLDYLLTKNLGILTVKHDT